MFDIEKFAYENVTVADELFDFVSDALQISGISMTPDAIDILYEDINLVADAIQSGSKAYLGLAIERLFSLKCLYGTHDGWNGFSDKCLEKQASVYA